MALTDGKAEGKRQKDYRLRILLSAFLLLPSLILFLAISLHQLDLPGLYYDEGFDLTPMLNVMHSEPAELLRGVGMTLFGHTYPVMRMDYMGSLNGYLTLPFMAALGPGYLAPRLEPLVFSTITLILAWVLARRWFGDKVAAITALLLAVNPSFIWFTRQGITVTSVMTVFALGSWIVLDLWRLRIGDGRRRGADAATGDGDPTPVPRRAAPSSVLMLLAGLLLGLGLWAKIVFMWWLALTAVAGAVWLIGQIGDGRREMRDGRRFFVVRRPSAVVIPVLCLGAGFVIGAAPFIYYNLSGLAQGQPPATFNLLFRALLNPTEYAVNNSNFWANLDKRFQDFAVFLNGSYFWYLANVPYGNIYAVPTFIGSVILGALLVWPRVRERRKWLAVLLCVAVYLPMSSFTVSDLWATHFFVLLPLPQMLVACAAVWLGEWLGEWIVARVTRLLSRSSSRRGALLPAWVSTVMSFALAAAMLAPTFSRDIWVNEQYHAALAQTGGTGRFSDAVYKLADHLVTEKVAEPIALDWGISQQIRVLTGDQVRPREVFGFTPEPTDEFRQQIRDLLQDSNRQYVVLWAGDANFPGFAVYNRRNEFTQIANAMGKQVVETFIAHERSGLPVYVILQAK